MIHAALVILIFSLPCFAVEYNVVGLGTGIHFYYFCELC
jgi:hypothetical protein